MLKSSRAGGESRTTDAAIVVVDWSLPVQLEPGEPMRFRLVSSEPRWRGFEFRLTFGDDGRVAGVEVSRSGDAAPLTAHLLQRVPLGALEHACRQRERDFAALALKLGQSPSHPAQDRHARMVEREHRDPDARAALLARLAKRYVETLGPQLGVFEDEPTQAEQLGEEFSYSAKSIAKLIREARNRGLLTPTSRGRPGGQLTDAARRLLGEPGWRNAWESATPEQRDAAIERERRLTERHAELLAEYRAGTIDAATYTERCVEGADAAYSKTTR